MDFDYQMETLVVVEQHRNHYYGRVRSNGSGKFGSSPSRNFREINCRTFQSSSAGILPSPIKHFSSPVAKKAASFSSPSPLPSPKTPSSSFAPRPVNSGRSKGSAKSTPIPISNNGNPKKKSFTDFNGEALLFSELWAGPAYSNSPPPSSLPMPKFSLREKRSVSLELPGSDPVVPMHPIAKSAPSSPTGGYSPAAELFGTVDTATRTLRRILNLDGADE